MADSLWIIPFGKKYKGYPIEDVPTNFLEWCLEQDWFCSTYADKIPIVQKEIKFRNQFGKEEKSIDSKWNRNIK